MSYNYMLFEKFFRRGAGVAERAALEMPYARERIEGSNPSLSAICNRTLVRVYKLLREIERTLWFAYSANAVHYTIPKEYIPPSPPVRKLRIYSRFPTVEGD